MKRIVSVQDISCFGKCSLTVALPILSAMGTECCIVPTAVLSTHTGGFTGYTFRDLSEDIPKIAAHWKSIPLHFDALSSGYLGSEEQVGMVADLFALLKDENTLIFVDPAMADNGKLYKGFNEDFPKSMAKLCAGADVVVPNVTEACFMLGLPCPTDGYDRAYVLDLLNKLCGLGCRQAVLTGVIDGDRQGAVAMDAKTGETVSSFDENLPVSFHGTGDIFSAVLLGSLTKGKTMQEALDDAVAYTVACIRQTVPDRKNHSYGVKFEECLPMLWDAKK